jgi:FKBP-type peptidyl-prolyl cis-trans isomerase 2
LWIIMEINKAVQEYLDGADKNWTWEAEVKNWDKITVDYIWRLEDGTVFDTSIESVAKACGKYNEARDYSEGLSFEVWAGQMIKWFDEWVIWMKVWQTKTVQFWSEKWYGQRRDEYVMTYSAEEVWDLSKFTEGQRVYLWIWAAALITKVTDNSITLDLNHELAGKDLIFDITIKSID